MKFQQDVFFFLVNVQPEERKKIDEVEEKKCITFILFYVPGGE